jgi:hypothetical protein
MTDYQLLSKYSVISPKDERYTGNHSASAVNSKGSSHSSQRALAHHFGWLSADREGEFRGSSEPYSTVRSCLVGAGLAEKLNSACRQSWRVRAGSPGWNVVAVHTSCNKSQLGAVLAGDSLQAPD